MLAGSNFFFNLFFFIIKNCKSKTPDPRVSSLPLLPVFHSHSKAGTRESPRPKGGAHGRDAPAPPLPPPPPPPPPLLRERSERAEAREHARELQAMANSRGSANGLPLRRTSEDLRKQVVCGQKCPALVSQYRVRAVIG